jgi:hypothetical protein
VYGRRKTGKTFLLRNCAGASVYVTVGRSGSCLVEEEGRGTARREPRGGG